MAVGSARRGTSDLEHLFRRRVSGGAKLFLPYLTAGLPSPQGFVELAADLAPVADAFEVGLPFSDPIMDGPVIQEASQRALDAGATAASCFSLVRETIRHTQVPVVLMTYFNPIHRMGIEKFVGAAAAAGVGGLIVPDLPHEEASEVEKAAGKAGVAFVQMVAPTTGEKRMEVLCKASRGFVYAVSRLGVTGEREALDEVAGPLVERVRAQTDLPVLLGVGISGAAQAAAAARVADGVILGSALMKRVLEGDPGGAARLAAEVRGALGPRGG